MTWDPKTGSFSPGGTASSSMPGKESSAGGGKYVTVADLVALGLLEANGATFAVARGPGLTRLTKSISEALKSSAASIEMNSADLLKKMNGAAGVVLGSAGLAGYDSTGTATFTIDAETGDVTLVGTITASAGAIGGFSIGSDYIRDAADSFGLASTVTAGDDVRFWAGATFANRATAPMFITEAGAATFANITVTGGDISTTGHVIASGATVSGGITASIIGAPTSGNTGGVVGFAYGNGYGGYFTSSGTVPAVFGQALGSAAGNRAGYFYGNGIVEAVNIFGNGATALITSGNISASGYTITATTFSGALSGNASTATNVAGTGLTGTSLASNIVTSSLTTVGELSALNVNVATTAVFKASAGGSNAVTVDSLGNINAGCSLGTGVYYCQNSAGETFNSAVASLNVKGGIIIGHT